MIRPASVLAAAGLALVAPRSAGACPCQGTSGAAAGVTTAFDRFGASVTETARVVHGTFRDNGRAAPLAPGSQGQSLDVTAVAGYRVVPALELSLEMAAGRQSFSTPDVASARTAFGDTTTRLRWDAVDEPMPYERPAWSHPAVTVVLSLRAPTAPSGRGEFSGQTGSVGASASSEGLGAWEPALGVALVKSFAERWQVSLFGEGAYRFSDTFVGRSRHLAPRALAQLGARYAPTSGSGVGVTTDLGVEGDVAYRGVAQRDTDQRLWTVAGYGYFTAEPTRLRVGALVRTAPSLDGASKNATRATSFGVSLGYAL